MNIEVTCVNTSEIKKALKGTNIGKSEGADGLPINLIKDAGDVLLDKHAIFFGKRLEITSVPSTWKNTIIILIHTERGHQKPKKAIVQYVYCLLYTCFSQKWLLLGLVQSWSQTSQKSKQTSGVVIQPLTTSMSLTK